MTEGKEKSTPQPKFKVGQIVMLTSIKKPQPFIIQAIESCEGSFFYAWNRNNYAAESMVRELTPEESGVRSVAGGEPEQPSISLEVFQHDWIPGFAAFHSDGVRDEGAKKAVVLNIGSLLCAVESGDLDKRDLPYMIAESLMHETVHALEEWAGVEFSEDRVEELLTKYREKYARATIWEYTGAEPSVPAPPQGKEPRKP